MKTQNLPEHLSAAAVALYGDLSETCRLETERDRQRLLQAVELWDRAEACRRQIATDGVTIADRFKQTKPHPLLIAERSSRVAYSRLLESLSQLSQYELQKRAAFLVAGDEFEEDIDELSTVEGSPAAQTNDEGDDE